MSNIFGDFRRVLLSALDDMVAAGALPAGLDFARVAVEPPRDPAHGDLATNAAMVLAGVVKQNPMALAVQIGGSLLVIFNRSTWLGAGALAVFTAVATFLAHAFWKLDGAARFSEMNVFMEHIALIAGFVFAAMLASGESQPAPVRSSTA